MPLHIATQVIPISAICGDSDDSSIIDFRVDLGINIDCAGAGRFGW